MQAWHIERHSLRHMIAAATDLSGWGRRLPQKKQMWSTSCYENSFQRKIDASCSSRQALEPATINSSGMSSTNTNRATCRLVRNSKIHNPWRRKRSKQDLSFFEMSLQTGRQILNPLRKNGVLVHVENVFALFYIVFWTKKCCQPPPNQVRKHQPSSFRQQSWTTNQQWTIINRKPLITTFPSSIIKSNSNHP